MDGVFRLIHELVFRHNYLPAVIIYVLFLKSMAFVWPPFVSLKNAVDTAFRHNCLTGYSTKKTC